jgi:hypothetical protein
MNCPNCNAPIDPDAQVCGECGYELSSAPASPPPAQPSYAAPEPGSPPADQPPSATPPPPYGPVSTQSGLAAPPPPKKSRNTCLIAGVIGLVVVACLCIVGVIAAAFWGYISVPFFSTTQQAPESGESPLDVVNNLDVSICYLLISPSASDEWGDDWLGDDEVIDPGTTKTILLTTGETYDFQVYDCDQVLLDEQYEILIPSEGVTYTIDPVP